MQKETCPTESELRALMGKNFHDPNLEQLIEHIDRCDSCQERFGALETKSAKHADASSDSTGACEFVRRFERFVRGETLGAIEFFEQSYDVPDRLGNYRIEGELGRGGMGVVYKAWDAKLHRTVAIKRMRIGLAKMPDIRQRILNEARAVAGLHHPNIVSVFVVEDDADPPYFVMEYVDGPTLHDWLSESSSLSVGETVRIAHQIATGLAVAHEKNVIHCDLKPANILLSSDRSNVRIADFGVSLAAAEHDSWESASGYLGTPHFMSPEQCRGEFVDARTDLFSLGILLFRTLTGQHPFEAPSARELREVICEQEAPKVSSIRKDVPNWLDDLVARLLSKEAKNRGRTARDVQQILEAQLESSSTKSRLWTAGGTLIVLFCVIVAGFLLMRSDGHRLNQDPTPISATAGPAKYHLAARMVAHGVAHDPTVGDAICTNGEWFAVGASRAYTNLGETGKVYVFRRKRLSSIASDQSADAVEFTEEAVLTPNSRYCRSFGSVVAMSNNTLVIGANRDSTISKDLGSAYVYRRTEKGWELEQQLTVPAAIAEAQFGISVAVKDNCIAIGSPEANALSGHVYIYRKKQGTWKITQQIAPSDFEADRFRRFGGYVAFIGDELAIGDYRVGNLPRLRHREFQTYGRVYLYEQKQGSWQPRQTLLPDKQSDVSNFGLFAAFNSQKQQLFVEARKPDSVLLLVYQLDDGEFRPIDTIEIPTGKARRKAQLATIGDTLFVVTKTPDQPVWNSKLVRYRFADGKWQQRDSFDLYSQNTSNVDFSEHEAEWNLVAPTFSVVALNENTLAIGQPNLHVEQQNGSTAFALLTNGFQKRPEFFTQPGVVEFMTFPPMEDVSRQLWMPYRKGPWPVQEDSFGDVLVLKDRFAYIPAFKRDLPDANNAGTVYVFEKSERPVSLKLDRWDFHSAIQAPHPATAASFGKSLAAAGDRLAVFEWKNTKYQAYNIHFYEKRNDQFQHRQSLEFEEPLEQGWNPRMAMEGNTLVVGGYVHSADPKGAASGTVYILNYNQEWSVTQAISIPELQMVDRFGVDIALDGDTLAIGCSQGHHTKSHAAGRVYVYERSGQQWDLQQVVAPGDNQAATLFGECIAIEGDTMAVGAPRFGERGAAIIFKKIDGQWSQHQVLTGTNDKERYFGARVELDGDRLVVGRVPHHDIDVPHNGTSYIFYREDDRWLFLQTIETPEPYEPKYSGTRVAIDDGTVLFTASGEHFSAGAVYAFESVAPQQEEASR